MPIRANPFFSTAKKIYLGKQEVEKAFLGGFQVFGPLPALTLEMESGSYALSGEELEFQSVLTLEMGTGVFVLTGEDMQPSLNMILDPGSFTLTGEDVTLTFMGGGSPLADDVRMTQIYAETIMSVEPSFRMTQIYAETIMDRPPSFRMTQIYLETIMEV